MISPDDLVLLYESFEKHKKNVKDLKFLIKRFTWEGPISFSLKEIEKKDVWVDFVPNSMTSFLTNNFTDRSAKNYVKNFLNNSDYIYHTYPEYCEYVENMCQFVLKNKQNLPPVLLLNKSSYKKNGSIVDGMHRIVASLILLKRNQINEEFTLEGYLGS